MLKELVRLISEIFAIGICRMAKIHLVWMCHNVDWESSVYHERISGIRRYLFSKFSNKILVTDPLLVPKAKTIFPLQQDKIDYFTFGEHTEESQNRGSDMLTASIIRFIKMQKEMHKDDRLLFALCVGHANWKTAHFDKIPELLQKAEHIGSPIRIIVVGPLSDYYSEVNPTLIKQLSSDHRVFFHDGFAQIDEKTIAKYIDFYWRAYRDLSTPFTVYHSAALGKPILAQGPGFLEDMVKCYNLGATVKDDFSDLESAIEELRHWSSKHAMSFLESHSWDIGAQRILAASEFDVRNR